MKESSSERTGSMLNPPHLGELIRESMEEVGWNVTETADHWMRIGASYELAQARRERTAGEGLADARFA